MAVRCIRLRPTIKAGPSESRVASYSRAGPLGRCCDTDVILDRFGLRLFGGLWLFGSACHAAFFALLQGQEQNDGDRQGSPCNLSLALFPEVYRSSYERDFSAVVRLA
jgi:hypothetical protein